MILMKKELFELSNIIESCKKLSKKKKNKKGNMPKHIFCL